MAEKMAKGAVLNGYLKFIKKKWGKIGLEEAMGYAGLQKMPKDADWGPAEQFDKVLEWISNKKGIEYVKEAGRYSAKDLGIFGYIFGAIVGAEKLLKRAKEVYPTMFNYGDFHIEMKGSNSAIINIRGASLTKYDCPAWEGGLIGLMEITRSNGHVHVEKPDSPEDCKFTLEWD